MMTSAARVLPLAPFHESLGARFGTFGEWRIPLLYKSITEEHLAVRRSAGLFDISHMGKFFVEGPGALASLEELFTRRLAGRGDGEAVYGVMCNPQGGILDDLIIYRLAPERFLLIVNAATEEKDGAWVQEHLDGAALRNVSSERGLFALQGPRAIEWAAYLWGRQVLAIKPFHVARIAWRGHELWMARTGYTGEDGLEMLHPVEVAEELWKHCLAASRAREIVPCGFGARDTLRLESALRLYGHDMSEDTTPLEAGLAWTVDWDKGDFVGRAALLLQRDRGIPRRSVGLVLEERAIAREGSPVLAGGAVVGHVTSGTFAPFLKQSIALALLPPSASRVGTRVAVRIRGHEASAQVVALPFYRRGGEGDRHPTREKG